MPLSRPGHAAGEGEAGYQLSDWPRKTPTPALDTLDLQGRRVRLTDFKGRAVLLNFWASWCEPCRAEMPSLQSLSTLMGDDLAVLALNFKEPAASAERFARRLGLELAVLLDPQGDAARAWAVRIFPTTVLIDRRGVARQRVQGEVNWTGAAALGWVERLMAL